MNPSCTFANRELLKTNVRHGVAVLQTIRVAPASGGSQKSLVLFDLWLRVSDFCLLLHVDVLSCRGHHHLYQPSCRTSLQASWVCMLCPVRLWNRQDRTQSPKSQNAGSMLPREKPAARFSPTCSALCWKRDQKKGVCANPSLHLCSQHPSVWHPFLSANLLRPDRN